MTAPVETAARTVTARHAKRSGEWVVVLGATSAIARAMTQELARRGYRLLLAGRDEEDLSRCRADLRVRHGVDVDTLPFDALDPASHPDFVEIVERRTAGTLAGIVVAVGLLGDPDRATTEAEHAVELLEVNFVGVVSVLTGLIRLLTERRAGFVLGITSVAGDRGRQSNFVYGSAKAGLSIWLQGLRNRLHADNVRVITIKPGSVDTEMTFGRRGLLLSAQPETVGAAAVRALDRRRDVVYIPWFWRYIMWIIRSIPEPLFKRLRL